MPSLMWTMGTIYRCSLLFLGRMLADTGLKAIHCPYLLALARNPGLSQEQLAGRIHVNKSQVTRQLAALEENGYILRRAGEDKRVFLVYLTEKGEAILPKIREGFQDWNELVSGDLSEEEFDQLSGILDRMRVRAAEAAKDGKRCGEEESGCV